MQGTTGNGRRGCSYQKRVEEINLLFDKYARTGLSNREIWRRYIYPRFGISERTLYQMFKAGAEERNKVPADIQRYIELNLF